MSHVYVARERSFVRRGASGSLCLSASGTTRAKHSADAQTGCRGFSRGLNWGCDISGQASEPAVSTQGNTRERPSVSCLNYVFHSLPLGLVEAHK